MIATIPKIDFDEEIVGYKKIVQTAQAATQKVQKIVGFSLKAEDR